MNKSFNTWLDTFIDEKGIDLDETFEISTDNLLHLFSYGFIVECIKNTTASEQKAIKNKIVYIDFKNGDVLPFFRHLAKAFI